jgi:hypothetical protein
MGRQYPVLSVRVTGRRKRWGSGIYRPEISTELLGGKWSKLGENRSPAPNIRKKLKSSWQPPTQLEL